MEEDKSGWLHVKHPDHKQDHFNSDEEDESSDVSVDLGESNLQVKFEKLLHIVNNSGEKFIFLLDNIDKLFKA